MSEPSGPVNGQNRVVEGLVTTAGAAGYRKGTNAEAVTGSAYNVLDQVVTLGTTPIIGIVTEAAPATDTASSGLNGRLQRIAQNITTLIAKFTVGAGTEAAALRVTLPTDGTGKVGLNAGTAAIGKLAANSGVDIGDVDVTSSALPTGAATAALQGGGLPAALGAGGGLKVDGSGTPLNVSQPGLSGGINNDCISLPKSALTITGNTLANPTVVTTETHGLTSGQTVTISGSNSTPTIDGARVVTVISATTFSVPVNVTTAGTAGSIVVPAQPVPAAPLAGRSLAFLQAPRSNTASVYIGKSTVTPDDAVGTGGIELSPGQSWPIGPISAAVLIYACSASAAQKIKPFEVAA